MPTCPYTFFFASITKILPGPRILSTLGTCVVPNARAAMACAPLILKTRWTPATAVAANLSGCTLPSGTARSRENDLFHSRHSRRYHRHQHRRRIDPIRSRRVDADALERPHHLAEARIKVHPGISPLALVIGGDARLPLVAAPPRAIRLRASRAAAISSCGNFQRLRH